MGLFFWGGGMGLGVVLVLGEMELGGWGGGFERYVGGEEIKRVKRVRRVGVLEEGVCRIVGREI